MCKITLVNPQIASTSWRVPLGSLSATSIRFSLAYLSGCLKAAGHEVNLIDLRLLKGWTEYDTMLKKQQPNFLGVTMHTCEFEIAIECCHRAKRIDRTIKTCVGGMHPTMFPKECLDTKVVDYVLKGEGEISFPELIKNPDKFPSSFWAKTPNLDTIPFPDRELWPDYKKRIQFPFIGGISSSPMVEMLTSRGCPWQCRFCCGPGEQNLYTIEKNGVRIPCIRQRSVKNVMKELLQLHDRYKFRSIVFHDDQFFLNPKWVRNFCEAMHDYRFVKKGIKWWAASRGNLIVRYESIFEQMKKAGLQTISVGFESFSDRMLRWINKGATVNQNWEAVRILRKLGIKIYGNFMFGTPYSDGKWYPKDDIETARAILEIKPEVISCSFFTPIPGSYLYDFCVKKNLILSSKLKTLGLRYPREAKIKGVDYEFLNRLISFIYPRPKTLSILIAKVLRKVKGYIPPVERRAKGCLT